MKDEKGITLMVLILTVIIMMILVSAGINYGGTSVSEVKLQNFSYELQQIQGKVDTIHEKMSMEKRTDKTEPDYVTLNQLPVGQDITISESAVETLYTVKGLNYNTASKTDEKYYVKSSMINYTCYRYFSKGQLEDKLDIKNANQDVIINFKTREVISVKGQTYNDITYYRLEDMQ